MRKVEDEFLRPGGFWVCFLEVREKEGAKEFWRMESVKLK